MGNFLKYPGRRLLMALRFAAVFVAVFLFVAYFSKPVMAQICSCGDVGLTTCPSGCVDLNNDHNNCGACGLVCDAGFVCSSGQCSLSCQAGLTNCGGTCSNTAKDEDNCGACGLPCETGEVCSNGQCALACSAGTTACGDVCINTSTDVDNCGACGFQCAANETCSEGSCTTNGSSGIYGAPEDFHAVIKIDGEAQCMIQEGSHKVAAYFGKLAECCNDNVKFQGTCREGNCVETYGSCIANPNLNCIVDINSKCGKLSL